MHYYSMRAGVLGALLLSGILVRAQQPYKGEIGKLLAAVPIPGTSIACYGSATKATDASGLISIEDNGPAFKAQQDRLNNVLGMPAQGSGGPSPAQIEQMKQQAMQQAAAAQQVNGSKPDDPALMRLVGQAQGAIMQITLLTQELSRKVGAVDKSGIDRVPIGPNCPEVQQGGYAGPTCDCLVKKETAYRKARVMARDAYDKQIADLLVEYMGKLLVQVSIVDDMEAKTRYGDAINGPAFKQQVLSVQRQSLGAVITPLSIAGSISTDAAKEYAGQVNAPISAGCSGKH